MGDTTYDGRSRMGVHLSEPRPQIHVNLPVRFDARDRDRCVRNVVEPTSPHGEEAIDDAPAWKSFSQGKPTEFLGESGSPCQSPEIMGETADPEAYKCNI